MKKNDRITHRGQDEYIHTLHMLILAAEAEGVRAPEAAQGLGLSANYTAAMIGVLRDLGHATLVQGRMAPRMTVWVSPAHADAAAALIAEAERKRHSAAAIETARRRAAASEERKARRERAMAVALETDPFYSALVQRTIPAATAPRVQHVGIPSVFHLAAGTTLGASA